MDRKQRGFAAVEAAMALAVFLLATVLILSTGHRRRSALAASEENLHRLASITSSYAQDDANLFWGFSWRKGDALSQWSDLNNAPSDLQARANQAIDIIRRRADPEFGKVGSFADISYSTLVLADYLDEALPMTLAASTADDSLRGWQSNPESAPFSRAPYGSSYELAPAFFDKSGAGQRISQLSLHNLFSIPGGVQIGMRSLSDVAFPSAKVHLYDRHQRHFGARVGYFAVEEVRLPLLFADGSVSVRKTADGNRGWQPNKPEDPAPTSYKYAPQSWEPDAITGEHSDAVYGYLRWTREAIKGRDYGGPEAEP